MLIILILNVKRGIPQSLLAVKTGEGQEVNYVNNLGRS